MILGEHDGQLAIVRGGRADPYWLKALDIDSTVGDKVEVVLGLVHVDDHLVIELVVLWLALYDFMEVGDLVGAAPSTS